MMLPARASSQWQVYQSCDILSKSIGRTARSRRDLCSTRNIGVSNHRNLHVTNVKQTSATSTKAVRTRGSALFVLYSSFILVAGVAGGFSVVWGWKTWDYLRNGRQIAEADWKRSNDKTIKSIETTDLVLSLKKEGWIEDEPQRPTSGDGRHNERHLINDTLLSRGGLVTRYFRHPAESITVVVFVADYGCESWPDVIHGGVTSCLIDQAIDTHLKHFTDSNIAFKRKISMNYRRAVNPHVLYSVVVHNDVQNREKDDLSNKISVQILVNQMIRAPRYIETLSDDTKKTERTFQIFEKPKSGKNVDGHATLFLNQHNPLSVGIRKATNTQEGTMSWIKSLFPF